MVWLSPWAILVPKAILAPRGLLVISSRKSRSFFPNRSMKVIENNSNRSPTGTIVIQGLTFDGSLMTSDMPEASFPKTIRLLSSAEFDRVFRRRCSVADSMLIVYGCEGAKPQARLGLTVSRKYGGAIVRNRWKRLLREAFRLAKHKLPSHIDLVVLPRRESAPDVSCLQATLINLSWRLQRKLRSAAKRESP